MKSRYGENVLESSKGINFENKEATREEDNITPNINSENYANPPIPEGYSYFTGEWNKGFVIRRDSDKSAFVWVPVGSLDPDGTLDGKNFTEKFGRRNYRKDVFSEELYNEVLDSELLEQIESVKKYGGFYISRYNISIQWDWDEEAVSREGEMPWVQISFDEAMKVASTFENTENVKSHLPYGAEYDSVLAWIIKSKAKTLQEIAQDSTTWGNYDSFLAETGSSEKWCVNNIYDLAGNVDEWTQEKCGSDERVIRGGSCDYCGYQFPVAYRTFYIPDEWYGTRNGLRVVLCIK